MEGLPKKEEKNVKHFDKVIGISENQQENLYEYLNWGREKTKEFLIEEGTILEKTSDEKFMIDFAQNVADIYAKKYGKENPYHLTEDELFVLNPNSVFADKHHPRFGLVSVSREEQKSLFACKMFHEMIHSKSYSSLQKINKSGQVGHDNIRPARTGLSVYSRDASSERLENIEEALTAYLTHLFFEDYVKENLFFAEDLKIHGNPEISRKKELIDLVTIVNEILKKNSNEFKNQEDVFNLFLRAKFEGNLLPVARLIEKTFGRGSVHSFAEKTKKIKREVK